MYCESCRKESGKAIALFRGRTLCKNCLNSTVEVTDKKPEFVLVFGNSENDILNYCNINSNTKVHEKQLSFVDVIYDGAMYIATTINAKFLIAPRSFDSERANNDV